MIFDWISFLNSNNIEFVIRGPSVVRGNIAIRCPFCGDEDPSTHMGINLHGKGWGCWRNASHRGIWPGRLIQALLNCSPIVAQQIIEGSSSGVQVGTTDFADLMDRLSGQKKVVPRLSSGHLSFTSEYPLLSNVGMGNLFVRYLTKRGYTLDEIEQLIDEYELRYCISGYFSYRLIFPVYGISQLMTWTGRSIDDKVTLRYLTLPADEERVKKMGLSSAGGSIKEFLFNLPNILRSDYHTLLVTEGPLDFLRADFYGRDFGARATCTFGKAISLAQIDWLQNLRPELKCVFLFDEDVVSKLVLSQPDVSTMPKFVSGLLPKGIGDPANLNKEQVQQIIELS